MSNTSSGGLYLSANSSTSTLRPRAARLISYADDDPQDGKPDASAISTSSAASTPSRFSSRGGSPSPGLSRSKSTDKGKNARATRANNGRASIDDPLQPALWDPWNSIQGFASTFLGGDAAGVSRSRSNGAFKPPVWMKQDKSFGSKKPTSEWGPRTGTGALPASIEERQALLQAKKREALLLAGAADGRDAAGRYKRRDSDADQSLPAPLDESDHALVYLHKIQKSDTLPGVIIKYSCQGDVFRKVNRFWPNDNIQTRTHVVIPVDACAARGKKVDSPYLTQDIFDPVPGASGALTAATAATVAETTPFPELKGHERANPTSAPRQTGSTPDGPSSEPFSVTTQGGRAADDEFKHDSWVVLPSFPEPVEVLRVPRRILGYFPRPRRKSNAGPSPTSTTSTPKSSFDTLRHPPTHAAQVSASLNASPVRRPFPPRLNSGRARSSSTASPLSFADMLRGPGGVGTLRGLRTEVSRPGPAEDPLNKQFAQYLPDLAPPEEFPRASLRVTPRGETLSRTSTDSIRSTRSNSNSSRLAGEVGGAIEGWVRKMAAAGKGRLGPERMGDLIELETNSDLDGAAGQAGDETLVETPTTAADIMRSAEANTSRATMSATEEALLNERFPVRGRVRKAYQED